MWIRIDRIRIRIRIHKIWLIRIQAESRSIKSPNFQDIFYFLKVKKKIFMSWVRRLAVSKHQHLPFLGSDFLRKKNIFAGWTLLFPSFFSDFIPIQIRIRIRNPDPDPRTQLNPDPTGSTSLVETIIFRLILKWEGLKNNTYIYGHGRKGAVFATFGFPSSMSAKFGRVRGLRTCPQKTSFCDALSYLFY